MNSRGQTAEVQKSENPHIQENQQLAGGTL